ncbi:hypothetical protein [Laspinema olomoucense]|uniref:Uncharacterized protein n=1 Tax=Laspinema olomoucense D3b TaxID=2953688 RepID=A0ABT2NBS7_9CYAN|nr:hypothetical protein [Laspinema sp. D3b]MCT7980149.1 hypothetical protein [Laspinema sp. D3b]
MPDASGGACSIQLSHSPKAKLIVAEGGTTRLLFCGFRVFYGDEAIADKPLISRGILGWNPGVGRGDRSVPVRVLDPSQSPPHGGRDLGL